MENVIYDFTLLLKVKTIYWSSAFILKIDNVKGF